MNEAEAQSLDRRMALVSEAVFEFLHDIETTPENRVWVLDLLERLYEEHHLFLWEDGH